MFADNRKRKQDDTNKHHLSSSMPTNASSWTDFIYSSPSSPSNDNLAVNHLHHSQQQQHFNFDSFFDQHHLDHNNQSGSNSRRHSVAVGEMDYHSFECMKQDLNIIPTSSNNNNSVWENIQLLLNSTNTAGFHTDGDDSIAGNSYYDRPIHKRTLSLREDNPHYATLLSPALSTVSSTTSSSNFFTSSFLDALVTEENSNMNDAATIISDVSFMDTSSTTEELLKFANKDLNTITPSAITNEINTMADWLLEQQEAKEIQKQVQKRQRRSTNSLSPVSPSHTIGSSLSSMSPSPPITPMQPVSLGFEPLSSCQPSSSNEQSFLNNNTSKSSLISARIAQGETTASSLKPLIQEYLISSNEQPEGSIIKGERTVMVLTSRVAQKSYGTEKRFLCPPPTTILKGANWWTNNQYHHGSDKPNLLMTDPKKQQQQQLSSASNLFNSPMTTTTTTTSSPPKLTIHISGEAINQTGVIEWQTLDGTIIDASSTTTINSSVISGRCVSKQLYINDADEKRKRVEVLAKIQLGNGAQLGTFPSKGIKVISKPSKKRQSIKNMELCIHHGTTISLFNRIRSQTVSTKYLGVSNGHNGDSNGTCFVARTGSWDPFVIWIVDTARSSETTTMPRQHHPSNPHFPPPPAIALQTPSTAQQPIAVHYNQPVVLQCVTTGLVSPVMIIRKVDKGSMVLGGNRVVTTDDYFSSSNSSANKPIGGGECGDEALGDPVSQLHKIAFQIVQDPASNSKSSQQQDLMATHYRIPQSSHPVTYLACLNDVVGMHKVAYNRHLVPACLPPPSTALPKPELSTSLPANLNNSWTDLLKGVVVQGKLFDANNCEQEPKTVTPPSKATAVARRRMSSIGSSGTDPKGRRGSLLAERRGSSISDTSGLEGACWTEDVSDAAVWTIVGTDCATYTFWTPTRHDEATLNHSGFNMPFNTNNSTPITPFPIVPDTPLTSTKKSENGAVQLTITGENLTRDLNVWFGDVKSPHTEYKSREAITCVIPDIKDLLESSALSVEDEDLLKKKIPLLLVRGDGIVYRTDQFYSF